MSERIVPGDLVVVIGGQQCCGYLGDIGKIFRVSDLYSGNSHCVECGRHDVADSLPRHNCWDIYRREALKKINPPAVKDSTTTDKEIPCLT